MPSIPKEQGKSFAFEGYASLESDWEGFTITLETIQEDIDVVERFQTLLDGGCKCPHWGYQIAGESTYVFEDYVETFRGGEFFYIEPGHSPRHKAGSQWVTFSPSRAHSATQQITRTKL